MAVDRLMCLAFRNAEERIGDVDRGNPVCYLLPDIHKAFARIGSVFWGKLRELRQESHRGEVPAGGRAR